MIALILSAICLVLVALVVRELVSRAKDAKDGGLGEDDEDRKAETLRDIENWREGL
jgi:hypothetical protein